jgi:hypothetical protein
MEPMSTKRRKALQMRPTVELYKTVPRDADIRVVARKVSQ